MSKVYPGGAGVEWRAFGAKLVAEGPRKGVLPFEPRSVEPRTADGGAARAEPSTPSPPAPPPAPAVDLDALRRQSFQEGFQAGSEAAEKAARAGYQQALSGLRGAATAFEQARPALLAESQGELVELAFAIAKRVLRREIGVDPKAARAIASACLTEAGGAAVKRIWVHPADVGSVREGVGEGIEVVGDEALERGGAVVETERGRLDGSIDAQLDEIAKGLADA